MKITKSKSKLWSKLGSRAVFGLAVTELAAEYENFYAMSGDLCRSSGLARFQEKYPERFVNVGIAEQNMIGVAGGLSKDGTLVFATSFAPFITMRACEQVRMNLGYMQFNVKIVGLGSGLVMSHLGNSHYGLEDVSIMRSIPGITIISPADCGEIVKTVEAVLNYPNPTYIRLTGGPDNPIVYSEDYDFKIGKANILREGQDVAIIATGTMVYNSLKAAEILSEQGFSSTVLDMHTIKPLDKESINNLLLHKIIVTVEEHTVLGGLGSAVAEYLAPKLNKPPQLLIGINDEFPHAGSYEYLLEHCGLTAPKIAEKILSVIS